MLQALIIKTVIEGVRRAFLRNKGTGNVVSDVLAVKHDSGDPQIHNEIARVIAWLARGIAVILLLKLAQVLGFDLTPYLDVIFEAGADAAAGAIDEAAGG